MLSESKNKFQASFVCLRSCGSSERSDSSKSWNGAIFLFREGVSNKHTLRMESRIRRFWDLLQKCQEWRLSRLPHCGYSITIALSANVRLGLRVLHPALQAALPQRWILSGHPCFVLGIAFLEAREAPDAHSLTAQCNSKDAGVSLPWVEHNREEE